MTDAAARCRRTARSPSASGTSPRRPSGATPGTASRTHCRRPAASAARAWACAIRRRGCARCANGGTARSPTPSSRRRASTSCTTWDTRDRVKIGTSSNPRQRLAALWHDELLAFERGGRALEQRRHVQFADDRYPRTEWFRRSEALMAHIDALAAGVDDPWPAHPVAQRGARSPRVSAIRSRRTAPSLQRLRGIAPSVGVHRHRHDGADHGNLRSTLRRRGRRAPGAARAAEHLRRAPGVSSARTAAARDAAAAQRGRDRHRALPVPAAHRRRRDDRAGARRGVRQAHRAAAAAGARRALRRTLRRPSSRAPAIRRRWPAPRRAPSTSTRLHGAHARSAASGAVVRLDARFVDPRHVVGYVIGSALGELVPRSELRRRPGLQDGSSKRARTPAAEAATPAARRARLTPAGATAGPAGAATRPAPTPAVSATSATSGSEKPLQLPTARRAPGNRARPCARKGAASVTVAV